MKRDRFQGRQEKRRMYGKVTSYTCFTRVCAIVAELPGMNKTCGIVSEEKVTVRLVMMTPNVSKQPATQS